VPSRTIPATDTLAINRTASCHRGHTSYHLITKVKQRWARIVLHWVTTQMTSTTGAVKTCNRILWPGKASEKTPKGVIPPVCLKYRRTPHGEQIPINLYCLRQSPICFTPTSAPWRHSGQAKGSRGGNGPREQGICDRQLPRAGEGAQLARRPHGQEAEEGQGGQHGGKRAAHVRKQG
jgi:hypothetical protein